MHFLKSVLLFFGPIISMVTSSPINTAIAIRNDQTFITRQAYGIGLKKSLLCNLKDHIPASYNVVDSLRAELTTNGNAGITCDVVGHACGRVACTRGAEVFLCSEVNETLHVDCRDVEKAVGNIKEECQSKDEWQYKKTQGQQFDRAGWNVIVHGKDSPGC